ncbi:hypothetical protein GCM10010112_69410 [Actinoplanes lobatus]|uniref:Tetratricopeptide (TPR) repeat protein n=1 Tax=Actinoplanes lobatus TaxID=113568 RepID=A0A7W7HMN9_9ACTN|nr:hypothetical protein [Actinoplanes lobatus]MBB4753082.1 tetratricopeptide (TPR) repeat protein [Actinoplanes lobatus]GGN87129.1 hypothetical protein GCM10010112_69410 [Actinoplanes lobatus]GIE39689.1 hypothetical protein Alo02nite_25870 [Actinoplanes lobatus]
MSSTAFVDRENALEAFGRFLAGSAGEVLAFSGMSGLGKSFLLAELARRAGPGRARVLDLEALVEAQPGEHTDVAFALTDAVAAVAEEWTGSRFKSYRAARERAEAALAEAHLRVPTVSLIARDGAQLHQVAVTVITDPVAVRAAGVRSLHRDHLTRALADDLRAHRPAGQVLLLDSVERLTYLDEVADTASGGQSSWFLSGLLPQLTASGLRVVLAGREALPVRPGTTHVTLEEWAPGHTAELLASRGLGDAELAAAIHRTCGGLPGWVDLAAAAVDAARDSGAGLTAAEIARRAAVHPVQRWLPEVFLDRLPPATHVVLAAAAVPRMFGRAAVAALLDDVPDGDDWFTALDRYAFVRTETGRDGEVTRTLHPLVRTSLLESLRRDDPETLTRLHQRARDHFARIGSPVDELYHRLALRDPSAVAGWRQWCGDAVAAADFAGARTALGLLLAPEQRGVLLAAHPIAVIEGELTSATVCRFTGRPGEAAAHLDEAQRLAGRFGNREALGAVAQERARLALRDSRITDGLGEARVALQLAEDLGLPSEIGNAHDLCGDLSLRAGEPAEAEAHFSAAIAAYRLAGNTVGEANALLSLGTLVLRTGNNAQAREHLAGALSRYVEAGRRSGQADAHIALGQAVQQAGDLGTARTHLRTAERIKETLGDDLGAANCRYRLAEMTADEGDPAAAETAFGVLRSDYERLGDRFGVANSLRGLAAVALRRRDFPASARWLERAETAYHELESGYGIAMCRYLRGRLMIETHDPAEAARLLTLAADGLKRAEDRPLHAHAVMLLALLHIRSGAVAQGEGLLRIARNDIAATRPADLGPLDEAISGIERNRRETRDRLGALTPASRLLLDLLALVHVADSYSYVVSGVWAPLWESAFPGRPLPSFAHTAAALTGAGLIEAVTEHTPDVGPVVRYSFADPALRPPARDAIGAERRDLVNELMATAWAQVFFTTRHAPNPTTVRAGLGMAIYSLERHDDDTAWSAVEETLPIAERLGDNREVLGLMREVAMRTGSAERYATFAVAAAGDLDAALEMLDDDDLAGLQDAIAAEIHDRLLSGHRPGDALALAESWAGRSEGAEHVRWLDRRAHGLYALGRHDDVVTAVRDGLSEIDRWADDLDDPDRSRVSLLHCAVGSAKAAHDWQRSLDLNERIQHLLAAAGADEHERAHYRFSDNAALMELGRFDECELLLGRVERVFAQHGDTAMAEAVAVARDLLVARRGDPGAALGGERAALRRAYATRDPLAAARLHVNYANHLRAADGEVAVRVAHRIAAAVLYDLTGNATEAARSVTAARAEPSRQGFRSTRPAGPDALAGVLTRDPGVDLRALLGAVTPRAADVERAIDSIMRAVRKGR